MEPGGEGMKHPEKEEKPTEEVGPDVEGFIVPVEEREKGIEEGVVFAVVAFTVSNPSPWLDLFFGGELANNPFCFSCW